MYEDQPVRLSISPFLHLGHERRTRADTVGAVDEDHRQDGHVPRRLDRLAVVIEVVEERVIGGVEDGPGDGGDVGEDVTRRGSILATLEARAELAVGVEDVDVV